MKKVLCSLGLGLILSVMSFISLAADQAIVAVANSTSWLGWITNPVNLSIVLGFLFFLSEFLAMFPKVKANGVFQFLYGLIKKGHEKFPEQK